jgi:hypothetical protein
LSIFRLPKKLDKVTLLLWIIAISLAGVEGWFLRFFMSQDGISYMDMGDSFFSGNWNVIIHAYWSPIYCLLIGMAIHIIEPASDLEFPVVNLVNFFIFLFSLICFHFFLDQLISYQQERDKDEESEIISPHHLKILGYSLFICISLYFITIYLSTPDMLVSAIVYLVAGQLISIRRDLISEKLISWRKSSLLGLTLGTGFLAKTILFPLSFVFIAVYYFSIRKINKSLKHIFLVLIIFIFIAGPYIFLISKEKGRFTFGESGKLTYLFVVNSVSFNNWQGEDLKSNLIHPTRKIFNNPPIYEFATPIIASYPPWYDPTYWLDGAKINFSWINQKKVLMRNVEFYLYLLYHIFGSFCFVLLVLTVHSNRRINFIKSLISNYTLIVPALVGFSLYALITVETRYIGAYFILFWLGLFTEIKISHSIESNKMISSLLIASIIAITIISVKKESFIFRKFIQVQKEPLIIAKELRRLGLKPGDKIGIVNLSSYASLWARMDRLKIVSQIPEDIEEMPGSSDRNGIINAFLSSGASYLISHGIPKWSSQDNWIKIENTDHYLYRLDNRVDRRIE